MIVNIAVALRSLKISAKRSEKIKIFMPKITDCLKAEREAAGNVIRLVRNNNFLRAYNRSAWLFQRVVTEYRVKRQFIKSVGEEVFFIGFPKAACISMPRGMN